jgi:glucose/arabinose dehydrogenase
MIRRGVLLVWSSVLSAAAAPMVAPVSAQDVNYALVAALPDMVTDIAHAGDARLFIARKRGIINIVENGVLLGTPFLDIDASVVNPTGDFDERGLLGLAFHPDYSSNGFFYVNYIDNGGDTVIARYSVSGNPNVADPLSESVILTVSQPFANHNAGDLAFGPDDGYLYIPFGDGGLGCDPSDRAQDPQELLGKILRIDVDGGSPYAIPPSNPFVGDITTLDEIWALGVRNPWRVSFDRQAPHDFYIADVGQNAWEELNVEPGADPGGHNYGWDCYEGDHLSSEAPSNCSTTAVCNPLDLTFPDHEYDHGAGRCSITGGFVYRGSLFPGFAGEYFFADFCAKTLWSRSSGGTITTYNQSVPDFASTFGEDAAGEIYVAALDDVYRIEDASVPPVPDCPTAPDPGCDGALKSILKIKDKDADGAGPKDLLIWKWVKGPPTAQAAFGDPTATAAYDLCLYAGSTSALVLEAHADPGGSCAGRPCWKPISTKGYKFKDSTLAQDGLLTMILKGNATEAKSKIVIKGKGGTLDLSSATLPLDESGLISVRVHNSDNSTCWGADFDPNAGEVRRNDDGQFKGKSG